MAWVTKDSVETYDQTPEPPREYTKKEKAQNWWHYHWVIVAVVILCVLFAAWVAHDIFFQTKPDVQIAYVGTASLPADTVTALEDALTPYCTDVNGDGQVIVQVDTYTIDFTGESESGDSLDTNAAYNQMAGVTRLNGELSSGSTTCIFLLEDPENFEKMTGALRYLDGTTPEDQDGAAADWQQMVYRWTDCPVLTGLDLGSFDGYTALDDITDTNQNVLAHLYVGCRGVWDNDQAEAFADGFALWDTLTAGAVSTAAE